LRGLKSDLVVLKRRREREQGWGEGGGEWEGAKKRSDLRGRRGRGRDYDLMTGKRIVAADRSDERRRGESEARSRE